MSLRVFLLALWSTSSNNLYHSQKWDWWQQTVSHKAVQQTRAEMTKWMFCVLLFWLISLVWAILFLVSRDSAQKRFKQQTPLVKSDNSFSVLFAEDWSNRASHAKQMGKNTAFSLEMCEKLSSFEFHIRQLPGIQIIRRRKYEGVTFIPYTAGEPWASLVDFYVQ